MNTIIFVTLMVVLVTTYLAFSIIKETLQRMHEHLIAIEEHVTEDVEEYESIIQEMHERIGKMIQATSMMSESEMKNLEKRFHDKATKTAGQVKRIIEKSEKANISLMDALVEEITSKKEKDAKKLAKKQAKK